MMAPHIPTGTYTGDLAFYNELVIIPTIVFWGLASDKTGRMPVFVISLVIMALGIFLSAFARSWVALVMFRLVYALGASGSYVILG
jgi:MFS family permease